MSLPPLIAALKQAAAYPHPVGAVRVAETHISWVLLTGAYAYKIKKSVNLGFVDFSTLEQRRQACLDELRLNRRFAPQLYLDVVPITGTAECPRIGGDSEPFEYAVQMREFPQDAQLDRLLAAGQLDAGDMQALGESIAALHADAPRADAALAYARPAQIRRDAQDNLDALAAGTAGDPHAAVAALAAWTDAEHRRLAALMAARHDQGFVRELHGDLHLANLVRIDQRILPFDCIEFSAALRWNDTISDLAFLTMDLRRRGHAEFAYPLLNRYLERSGDYAGMRLLRFYEVYRALVRAKIAMIRRDAASGAARAAAQRELEAYLGLAQARAAGTRAALVLMHGLSGSGKTRLSSGLIGTLPALRVRSDVERKRLHGLDAAQHSGSAPGAGIYTVAASAQTYALLAQAAHAIIAGGETAVVDAAFLRRADRARFRALAQTLGVPLLLVSCSAPPEVLRARLQRRAASGTDASEADLAVLERQLASAEPLDADERARAIEVATTQGVAPDDLAQRLRARLPVAAGAATLSSGA